MFRVDKSAGPASLLCFGDSVQGEGGFARAFRPINFNHPPARQAADAKCKVQAQRAGRNNIDCLAGAFGAHAHNGTLAEGALNLRHRGIQSLVFFHIRLPARRRFPTVG